MYRRPDIEYILMKKLRIYVVNSSKYYFMEIYNFSRDKPTIDKYCSDWGGIFVQIVSDRGKNSLLAQVSAITS